MLTVRLVLIVLALVQLALAAVGVPSGRFGLIAGGLFAWLLSTVWAP